MSSKVGASNRWVEIDTSRRYKLDTVVLRELMVKYGLRELDPIVSNLVKSVVRDYCSHELTELLIAINHLKRCGDGD
jgi:hypothetical protein